MSESKLQTMNQNKELQKWISLVAECRSSGMSVKEWCKGKDGWATSLLPKNVPIILQSKQNELKIITGSQDFFLALFLPVNYLTLTEGWMESNPNC